MDFSCRFDVVVAGAGVAGIAAALGAARRGKKAALVEKQTLIGGLATSGLILVYLPLCDGHGTQVTFGISEEMLKRSMKYGPFDLPEEWGGRKEGKVGFPKRYACYFSPAGFTLELDKMLEEAGVELFLDTFVTGVETDSDERITAIHISNTSGNGEIRGGCFVDATGDATLVRRAGGEFYTDENFVTPWFMENSSAKTRYNFSDAVNVKVLGNMAPEFVIPEVWTGKSATAMTRRTWKMIREYYDAQYKEDPEARRTDFPLHLPAMPQFRKICAIRSKVQLTTGQCGKHFDDSIGLYGDWRKSGWVWETPYGTLLPEKIRNVLAAGRCMGCTGDAWEAFRVIPSAAMTGEAAGVAAAMSLDQQCDPCELSLEQLRDELRKNGFKFHLEEVGLSLWN